MSNRPVIVVTEAYEPGALERLRGVGEVVVLNRPGPDELRKVIVDAHALLVRTYTQVTAGIIDAAPALRVIGRGGAGTDNIDLEAARHRGIAVVNTPAASTDAVADLTVGLLLSVVRGIGRVDELTRAGKFFEARESPPAAELRELTLGIVGMGRIGKAVASRCHSGFGMAVVYNDIVDVGPLGVPARAVSKEELYATADVVSLHVPLTELTRRLIDEEALVLFRPSAVLLNTARGPVVDNGALAEALASGMLGGAGLDVTDPEPLPAGHPLLEAPNLVLTPHVGARTRASLRAMSDVVSDVIAVLSGAEPRWRVV